jgi:uracil-DNA glycosylase family 4
MSTLFPELKTEPFKILNTKNLGCDNCPSNNNDIDVNKLFNKMKGKKLVVFAQSPSYEENSKQEMFTGRAGKWVWEEFEKVGVKKSDCDIQYAVRCFSATTPSKEAIKCCTKYTAKAIAKSEAKVYVLFGAIAAKQVCGTEYKKDRRIFWSERLKARVYCLDHPSYFIHGGTPTRLLEFREGIAAAAADVTGRDIKISRHSYIEEQDYKLIRTVSAAKKEYRYLLERGRKGIRTSIDLEYDKIGKKPEVVPLVLGTCAKVGRARIFVCDHPRAIKRDGKWQPLPLKVANGIKKICKKIIENPEIKKLMQHGSSDEREFRKLFDAKIHGYDYDTEYAEYLLNPNQKAYGLAKVAEVRFPRFVGYKVMIIPSAIPKGWGVGDKKSEAILKLPLAQQYDKLKKKGIFRFSQIPINVMRLYNGADCDLTKRMEVTGKKKVPMRLLTIYKDAAFVLDKMEGNGPFFDYEHSKKLRDLYPPRAVKTKAKLMELAGKIKVRNFKKFLGKPIPAKLKHEFVEFMPTSVEQVKYVIFKKLKIEYPFALEEGQKINTQKSVMEVLAQKHEFPKLLLLFRKLAKIESTYMDSYEECARAHADRLKTKWWLTGTGTGRLSSGGNKGESEDKVVNLQNVHGDVNLKNLLTPDPRWRELYSAIGKSIRKVVGIDRVMRFKKALTANGADVTEIKKEIDDILKKSLRWKKIVAKLLITFGSIALFLGYDFGQIEVRVMAQISQDKMLIKDCMGDDIHGAVGHSMTGWPIEAIRKDKKTRTLTKNIHFGILFGLGKSGLYAFIKAKDPETTMTEEKVSELYDAYFNKYKGVRKFIERQRAKVELAGYVENIFGFKRDLNTGTVSVDGGDDDDDSTFDAEKKSSGAYWGNQAVNTPVQGAAHQLMLMAIRALQIKKKKYKLLGVPMMEVHDAIYFAVKLKDILKGFLLGKELLEKEPIRTMKKMYPEIDWVVPLKVEGECGLRLGDTVEAEKDGELFDIGAILSEMFFETFTSESKLSWELANV